MADGLGELAAISDSGQSHANIWDDALPIFERRGRFNSRRKRLVDPSRSRLGASVWEIAPGAIQSPYHFHHLQEELLVVLRGQPTLRGPGGEQLLEEGDVVHFPTGPSGAHSLRNGTEQRVRVLWVSELADAEIAEFPDSGKIRAATRRSAQTGERLVANFRLADSVEYLDGET